MTRSKLTKRVVDSAVPHSSRYTLFDTEIRGFGLRVFPSGQKSWVLEYKAEGGRRATTRRVTIGRSVEFTPDEARKIADKLRSKVKIGIDPQADKKAQRSAPKLTPRIGKTPLSMTRSKLTKRVVDGAVPHSSLYTLFDTEIRGFGLRVFPSGQKSWVLEYKAEGGRRATTRRVTIGRSVEFTPDEARKIADKLRSKVKIGIDPQADKKAQRSAPKLTEVAELFLTKHVAPKRKRGTKARYEDILNRIVLPALGTRKAKDITRADIAKLHLEWSHTPFQANRILAIVGSMYSFAGKNGLVSEGRNPARGVDKYPEHRRERLLSVAELERIGAAVREAETTGIPWEIDPTKKVKHVPKKKRQTVIGEHAAAALRLLLFTGARVGEILSLKWEHVDLDRGLLLLPDSKTGRKTIVLNAPALAVLTNLRRVGAYVVAGESDDRQRSDLKRPWQMVRRWAKLDGMRLHDLRHNFASFGAGSGLGLPIIGKLLGHTQAATTQRYAHLDADPLRRASNVIGNTIAAAMGEPVHSAEVTPLEGAHKFKKPQG